MKLSMRAWPAACKGFILRQMLSVSNSFLEERSLKGLPSQLQSTPSMLASVCIHVT